MTRLTGCRPLLTRSAGDSAQWAAALRAEGARPTVLPCITTEVIDASGLGAKLDAAAVAADWIVFTSRRGVDAFTDLVATPPPSSARLAAVGESTAARLTERFGRVDLTGPGNAADLAATLGARVAHGDRCVLVLAQNADDRLERGLVAAGASVDRFDVYRTVPAPPADPRRELSSFDCNAVIFASPTAVTGFANQVNVDTPTDFVTIGPSTSAAVRARRWNVTAEARKPGLSGIIESLLEANHVRDTA